MNASLRDTKDFSRRTFLSSFIPMPLVCFSNVPKSLAGHESDSCGFHVDLTCLAQVPRLQWPGHLAETDCSAVAVEQQVLRFPHRSKRIQNSAIILSQWQVLLILVASPYPLALLQYRYRLHHYCRLVFFSCTSFQLLQHRRRRRHLLCCCRHLRHCLHRCRSFRSGSASFCFRRACSSTSASIHP